MATAGLIVGSVFKEMFVSMFKKMFTPKQNGHTNGNGNGNGSTAVVDAIQHQQVVGILNQHTTILQNLASSNDKIKDGIVEMTTVLRERKA